MVDNNTELYYQMAAKHLATARNAKDGKEEAAALVSALTVIINIRRSDEAFMALIKSVVK